MPRVSKVESRIPVLTPTQAQEGLARLLHFEPGYFRNQEYAKQRDNLECSLEGHPFGLDTALSRGVVSLIAPPGLTDPSVKGMMLMLQHHAALYPTTNGPDFQLRIIRIQKPEKNWHKPDKYIHDLYFELVTGVGSFICAGVNDYSGAGGYGGEQLESAFKFIAALYEKPIEEHVILERDAKAAITRLKDAYFEFSVERRRRASRNHG